MSFFDTVVSPDFIIDFLDREFGNSGKVTSSGEYTMPSPFLDDDWKNKFSMNTHTGLWQDFRTHQSGDFVKFYALYLEIPYYLAKHRLLVLNFGHLSLEEPKEPKIVVPEVDPDALDWTKVVLIPEDATSLDGKILEAWRYLYSRKLILGDDKYYFCEEGRFKDRIIIPYTHDRVHYYFQARCLPESEMFPKYLNPTASSGVKSSQILYPYDETEDHLLVVEGPIDARTLQLQGVNATCTQGSYVSNTQIQELSNFKGKLIIGYDNDEAGWKGIKQFDFLRKRLNLPTTYICHAPKEYNDWNDAHCDFLDLQKYVEENSNLFDDFYTMKREFNLL